MSSANSTTTMSSSESSSSSSNSPTPVSSTTPSSASSASATASPTSIDTSSIAASVSSVISSELSSPTSTPTPTSTSSSQGLTSISTSSIPQSTTTVAPSTHPASTVIATSIVVVPGTGTEASSIIVTVTETQPPTTISASTGAVSHTASTTTTPGPALNTGGSNSGSSSSSGLSTAGVTAIAVVVPVAAVALLVIAGIFLWRKRKQKKAAEEARRKEVEDYGFNPNNDPTLPTVASESGHEMSEDHSSGYRGWGAATGANRKMSTTLSGGHTQGQLSDVGSSAYRGPNSPTHGSDGHSGDPLVNQRRETMNSDDIGALGAGPAAGATANAGMKRGPSNASSTYSAGGAPSETSDSMPSNGLSQSYEAYNPNTGFGYSQHGPYGDGTYGGAADGGMPVVRDVSARRNTRIQQPGNYQQGNSGISQNF